MNRLTLFLIGLVAFATIPTLAAADDVAASFDRVVRPFLQKHCFECHGPDKQTAGIRYDRTTEFRPEDRHLWTLVHERLAAGEMPPEDHPQPTAAEKSQLIQWIEERQRSLRGGGTRRLNRRELAAALRDLTGLAVDYTHSLPGDGKVDGFDTGAEGLQDAADSLAQIVEVTRRAVAGIRFLDPPAGQALAFDLVPVKDSKQAFDPAKALGLSVSTGDTFQKQGLGLLIRPKWLGERGGFSLRLPPPTERLGVLRLTVVVSAQRPGPEVPFPRLWVEVGGRDFDYPEITNPADEPRTLVYDVQLSDVAIDAKGLGITLSSRVEMPYAVKGYENEDKSKPEENIPGGTGLFRPLYDRKLPPDQQPVPHVVLHRIEIDGDYRAAWPPADWNSELGPLSDSPETARRLLALWIERAWRRPVAAAEQERFLNLYTTLRGQGFSFDDALRSTFQAVLLSGSFRYLTAPADAPNPQAAQYAIASRLSFMLWGAPPDRELRELATAGKLRDPAVLEQQVNRLLAAPHSRGFWEPFVSQWLEMGQPITIAMDHIQKQDFRFGRHLKASMQAETIAYVERLTTENRPARELFVSNWTMMNDILARHYGYPKLEGGELRKIVLRPDDPRGGGILSQAGIQSMLCWMGENWVIYRGAWALRHLLDDPPPPPPLEVPELIPSDQKNHGKSFKELLKQHQEDQRCAICHKSMDPLGFAFQNFDLSGRWRDLEYDHYVTSDLDGKIEWRGAGKTRPVDAIGHLPRGEQFQNFAECRQLLVKHYTPDLVRGLLKNLVLYGAGRKPDIDDLAEIRAIMSAEESRGYPLRNLLVAIVRSKAFLER